MKLIFTIILVNFIFLFENFAQQNRMAETQKMPHDSVADAFLKERQSQINDFVMALEKMLSGNDTLINEYYFSSEEAAIFATVLINSDYPDVDNTLLADILRRNDAVKTILDNYKERFTKVKLVKNKFRRGHTDAVKAFLITLNFGDDAAWHESLSLLLYIGENNLRILSLKDEN